MKTKHCILKRLVVAILGLMAIAAVCAGFEGVSVVSASTASTTNTAEVAYYIKLANGMLPVVKAAAGRSFKNPVQLKVITRQDMEGVLAADFKLYRAEAITAADAAERSRALALVTPTHYSISDQIIYIVPQVLEDRLAKAGIKGEATREAACSVLIAYELSKVLDDQQVDFRARYDQMKDPVKSRNLRALAEGHAQMAAEAAARTKSMLSLSKMAAAWSLGQGASGYAGLSEKNAFALEEEYDICYNGGYLLASHLYVKYGTDSIYRTYIDPPAQVGLLYNPKSFTPPGKEGSTSSGSQTGQKQDQKPDPSASLQAAPGNEPVPAAQTASNDETAGSSDLLAALREAIPYFTGDGWMEIGFSEVMAASGESMQAWENDSIVLDMNGYALLNIMSGSMVLVMGMQFDQEVTDAAAQTFMVYMEQSMLSSMEEDNISYQAGDIIPLTGLGFGSGWLQNGLMISPGGVEQMPTWINVARTENYLVMMYAINDRPNTSKITNCTNAIFAALQ